MFANTINLRLKDRNLAVGDPNFDSVVLLAPLSGEDGDTASTDLSNSKHALTFNGSIALDGNIRKFGFSSLEGTDTSGEYVSAVNSTDWDFTDGDFTVELHFRPAGITNVSSLVSRWQTAHSTRSWALAQVADDFRWIYSTGSSSPISDSLGVFAADTWYHIALCRDGTTIRTYIDGVQTQTQSIGATAINTTTEPLQIGDDESAGPHDGHIENVRITKGVCRYPDGTTFTPPTRAYPTFKDFNTPQPDWANVIYQTNFEGTDGAVIAQADDKDATNWTSGGAVQPVYDDAQTKFGTTSCRYNAGLNGFTGVAADGGGLEDINTQDFMSEQFHRYEDISVDRAFAGVWHTSSSRQWAWWWDQSAGEMVLDICTINGSGIDQTATRSWSPSVDVWYHVAISRESGTLRFFVDGQQLGTNESFSHDIFYNSTRSYLSGTTNDGLRVHDGWIESPRFVIGEAVYTSNFTVPTAHHPIG